MSSFPNIELPFMPFMSLEYSDSAINAKAIAMMKGREVKSLNPE